MNRATSALLCLGLIASPCAWSASGQIDSFGASAPYQQLYKHFGITAEAVVEALKARL